MGWMVSASILWEINPLVIYVHTARSVRGAPLENILHPVQPAQERGVKID